MSKNTTALNSELSKSSVTSGQKLSPGRSGLEPARAGSRAQLSLRKALKRGERLLPLSRSLPLTTQVCQLFSPLHQRNLGQAETCVRMRAHRPEQRRCFCPQERARRAEGPGRARSRPSSSFSARPLPRLFLPGGPPPLPTPLPPPYSLRPPRAPAAVE